MRVVENTGGRLVLKGGSPLFRPFFAGGLGLLALGIGFFVGGWVLGRSTIGPPTPGEGEGEGGATIAGVGTFLATFGAFLAIVPLLGRFAYRKEIVVDRAAGRLVRRDRTLVRLREESYPFDAIRDVAAEELRHVDGDPYFMLLLHLGSGEVVTLDRFTDGAAAAAIAGVLRDHLERGVAREVDRAGALPG